jgi:hypothetical protein
MQRTKSSHLLNNSRGISAHFARIAFLLPVLLGVLVLADGVRAGAQSQVRAVRLSDVEGSVQILRGDQTEFEQAFPNMPVLEASRLQTGSDGRAEVQFEDGAVARLTPNSSLNFNQLSRASAGGTLNQLEVLSGLAYFEIGADRKQQYSVMFGHNVITPNETSTFRVNMDVNPAEVVVLQGSVQAANANVFSVNVREGETVRFDADDARYFLAAAAEPDSWDQWNIDRDQALASMASRQTAVNGVGDQSGAGWSDLDQYGDWYSVPQYGNVWAPRGVDVSWDPYGSGYWAYYPGYGYVWVSSNPWGWLPYRCGGWSYFNGFGWGWLPSNCGNEWLTDVNIWNAPSYYRKPQRPHPVGPKDNLPGHGTLIAVNRGAAGGPGTATGGLAHSTAPRNFLADGRVIRPLPKAVFAQPERPIELAGPTRPVRLPADSDGRYRPMTAQPNQPTNRPGYQQGAAPAKAEYNGTRVAPAPSPSVELLQDGMNPYVVVPRAQQGTSGPGYGGSVAPRPMAPAAPMAPRQAPPAYAAPAPRYEQRQSAPSPPPAPRASSPAPESHSSSPAPAAAPAAGKK